MMNGWAERMEDLLALPVLSFAGLHVTLLQLLTAVLMLLLTWALARVTKLIFDSPRLGHVDPGKRYTLARFARYGIWLFGILATFKTLSIDLTGIAVIAGALGVGLGFGLQNAVSNFVSGLILLFDRPIRPGDRVTMGDVEGTVQEIDFRSTTIVTNDNVALIVPNSQLVENAVINWSYGDPKIRIHLPVGVAYGSDVALVERTLLEVAHRDAGILGKPDPEVWFRAFGESSLDFELLVWIPNPTLHNRVRSGLNFAIDAAFREAGIEIPFPQRDLHLRSVPEGVKAPEVAG